MARFLHDEGVLMVRLRFLTITAGLLCCLLPSCRKDGLELRVFYLQSAPVQQDVAALWFADPQHGVAVGGKAWEGGFVLSTDNAGATWRIDTLLNNRMEAITGSASGLYYACGMEGRAMVRFPGDATWNVFRTDYRWMRGAAFHGEHFGVIVSGEGFRDGRVFVFGPDAFWQLDTIYDFPNELAAVCLSDSLTAHAVGMGWVMRSEDAGRHWERLDISGDFFRDVQFPSPETGYICGSAGTLLKTTDGGRHWTSIRNGGVIGRRPAAFKALFFMDEHRGYVVGERGLFWKTTNGGQDWQAVTGIPEEADFTDVFAFEGKGWISAQDGRIYYFEE